MEYAPCATWLGFEPAMEFQPTARAIRTLCRHRMYHIELIVTSRLVINLNLLLFII